MRMNLPVTQRSFDFPDDATLMSSTDTSSHITYANEAFIKVSGYERDEILGSPHNLVRHPDMPREAFADMWATLKSGESWTALVKNRRKDGDHYWVRANATPVVRGGSVVGYMSVRTKPGHDEVQQAEALYRRFREGQAGSKAFRRGLIVHDVADIVSIEAGTLQQPDAMGHESITHFIQGIAPLGEDMVMVLDLARLMADEPIELAA